MENKQCLLNSSIALSLPQTFTKEGLLNYNVCLLQTLSLCLGFTDVCTLNLLHVNYYLDLYLYGVSKVLNC